MKAIMKHELAGFFHSLTAYVFGGFLLVFIGVGCMFYNIQSAVANFEYALAFVSIVFVGLAPILSMRVIAEERKQKTDQLLYSLPITTTEIVVGKFLALLVMFAIPLCLVCVYPVIFAQFGEVYLATSYSSLFAFFLMGAAFLALGTFISSLTENQGLAAGIGVAVILFNYYSVSLAEYVSVTALGSALVICLLLVIMSFIVGHLTRNDNISYIVMLGGVAVTCLMYIIDSSIFEELLPEIMRTLSLFERFYTFVNGVFDMTGIVYYLSVIVFFLFLTVQSLEKRRYN